ncbi:hypothetical protein Tco_1314895 [Tanacetum coccineum]
MLGFYGGSAIWSDKEVTKQDLVLKGGDRGACKLIGVVVVIFEHSLRSSATVNLQIILMVVLPPCDVVTIRPQAHTFWINDSNIRVAKAGLGRIPKNLLDRVSQLC